MRSIEVSAKSVDEAIFMGIDQLGLSIDQVDIEIIEEGGRRLFGIGTKQCVVRLTERAPEEVERVLIEQEKQAEEEKQHKRERQQARRSDRDHSHGERGRGGRERDRDRRRPRREEPVPERSHGEPVDGGAEAAFLRETLVHMGMENAVVEAFNDSDSLYLKISGPSMGILIGRRGETLNALQYLTSLIANRQEGEYRRVIVDTENYRGRREETLKRLAKRMAEDVRRTGKPVSMEPMNPYERRILHASLQENPYVDTHSEGEEPFRHVVITAK